MRRRDVLALVGAVAVTGVAGCTGDAGDGVGPMVSLTSSAVPAGSDVPREYTCDGVDVSPPLTIDTVPDQTTSLAIVVDDPDAGEQPFTHWLLYDIPPMRTTIPRDIPPTETVLALDNAKQGRNDFGTIGYRGPCPPREDAAHTYRFRVFAFEEHLDIDAGASRSMFNAALTGLIVGTGGFLSSYGR